MRARLHFILCAVVFLLRQLTIMFSVIPAERGWGVGRGNFFSPAVNVYVLQTDGKPIELSIDSVGSAFSNALFNWLRNLRGNVRKH